MRRGEFPEDLFYRLNVLPIRLPPLRERIEDTGIICSRLLEIHWARMDKPLKRLSPSLLSAFMKRRWEGNGRELENVLIQGILFSRDDEISPADLGFPEGFEKGGEMADGEEKITRPLADLPHREAKEAALQKFNEDYMEALLDKAEGNVTRAAQLCGLPRQSLQQVMRRFKIRRDTIE